MAASPNVGTTIDTAQRRGMRPDLSHAVLQGIAHARYHCVVVMDADLSHPPEGIPGLLGGLDVVVDTC